MQKKERIEFSQLEPGFEFPACVYQLDRNMVSVYLKATGDTSDLYQNTGLIPPMAVAAQAMAALAESISLPPGTIHVSQELEFIGAVSIEDTLTSHARVLKHQQRGNLHLLSVELNVLNQKKEPVLTGRTGFVLP